MASRIVAGSTNRTLAVAVAAELGVESPAGEVERFPDGELRPFVDDRHGGDG